MTSDFPSSPGYAPLLTIEETAALLRIGRTNTYGLVMAGQIQSVKIGRRRLVVASGLQVFIDRLIEEQG
ncbi:MAG: helix-turn-helix domain-containing protein [Acidimicrobiales bacterium]